MNPDELKSAWQAQASQYRLTIDADVLLQQFRRNKRSFTTSILWGESALVLGLGIVAAFFVDFGIHALREGLPWQAPWAFFLLALICVVVAGFKVFDRVQQMKWRPPVSDPILACVEEDLHRVRHEIRRWSKEALWWYLLPINAGAMILAIVCLSLVTGGWDALFSLLSLGFAIGAFTWAQNWFLRWYVRRYYEPRRQELEALLQSLKSNVE